ncbi:MAG: type VI secretion system contractile sheath small subunit [Paracoccus sp. (in: a-proteobacteria)]|uniref:type VI secretion system contractile sheath small subunit n=1 Tax=Paracoccus sp. TaxID=267 RepID=UPI0026DECBC9|nr:type VI secretion system contractile sheath small subunit [Paracoccus sp. (in: a-proteobacteria)]MDO5622916.1 type VI secretion system contractile sheath small subunit [Paracoccus sp. (in: a-proteobacteria)]
MASDKSTDFIKRNRPPRVNISYEDPYESEKMVELPFVMGVMSDLSGNASEVDKPELEERDFVDVTASSLDDYMKSIAPGLSFNVENKMGEDGRLGVSLHFESMDDFNPAAVARQIPALKKLLEARQHLANLQRYMNSKPKAQDQIRKLLNDPELMAALAEREADKTPQEEG